MTTRRLLAEPEPDVRAIHKHLVLLAKILLRADGHDLHGADEVLAALRGLHPEARCEPPGLPSLMATPIAPDVRQQLVDATDRLLIYLDHLDRSWRTST